VNQELTDKSSAVTAGRSSRAGGVLRKSLVWAFSVACLAWVFHDVELLELAGHMTSIRWGWAALAVAAGIVSYVVQGHRWKLLLRPTGDIPVLRTTQAIYVGLLTNTVVPLRVGELVRMFLVSRSLRVEFIAVLPSYLVERMIDAIWLAIAAGLSVLFVPLPRHLIVGERVLVGFVLVATTAFVFAVVKKGKVRGAEDTPSIPVGAGRHRNPLRLVARFIDRMAGGFHKIGLSRNFFAAAVGSLLMLVLQILALWLVMPAMGIQLSVWQGAVAFIILRLGTALPNTPSNVGAFQFFAVLGLELFGIDKTTAASFSVVSFVLLTIPLAIVGLFALWRTGLSFSEIRAGSLLSRHNRRSPGVST
jgi:uncharacterized protein (TIRG00374 family)